MNIAANDSVFARAVEYFQGGDLPGAEVLLQGLIDRGSEDPEFWHLLGLIALKRKEKMAACKYFARAAEGAPEDAKYRYNYGTVLQELGEIAGAVSEYEKALSLDPGHAGAHNNLGAIFRSEGQLTSSENHFREVLAIQPENVHAWTNLGTSLRDQGRISEAMAAYEKALACQPGNHATHSNMLLCMHYLADHDVKKIFKAHRDWADMHCAHFTRFKHSPIKNAGNVPKLRIGYVSADFCTHSVAYFLETLLFHHDRGQFTIFCYHSGSKNDEKTERFKNLPLIWRDIAYVDDEAAAQGIFQDGIHILVDCSGHTAGHRLRVFAQKPAPVQVTYIGYPDTTGLMEMDYRITDEWADPPGMSTPATESLMPLPGGFLCYKPPDEAPPVNPLPALGNGYITFGSFNNLPKLNQRVLELWGRLLTEIPHARLVLKTRQFNDSIVSKKFRGFFVNMGISGERIETVGYALDTKEHLQYYHHIDVALDPFPYNGTTTTYEALFMGIPVITLEGTTHAGRVGKSILKRIGLSQFVVEAEERYLALGKYLSENPEILSPLRRSLRDQVVAVNDGLEFTRRLERVFQDMWINYRSLSTAS